MKLISLHLFHRPSFIPLLLSGLFLHACTDKGPDFDRLGEGIEFRRVVLGDGDSRTGLGEGVGVAYRLTGPKRPHRTLKRDTSYFLLDAPKGPWTQMLSTMAKGDSSIFLLQNAVLGKGTGGAPQLPLPDTLERARLEISLLDRMPPFALLEWKTQEGSEGIDAARWEEWKKIQTRVEQMDQDPASHFVEGIYIFPKEEGKGPRVEVGREVAVHYRGYLPDSSVFDDSYEREEPLRFRYGDPQQVIKGMEIALKYMREGDEAEVVIPSYLAFEKKDPSKGIFPPNTFVRYTIEIANVEDP